MKPLPRPNLYLTAAELATVIGVTPAHMRRLIRQAGIKRKCTGEFGAHLYDAGEVMRHAKGHDRRASDECPTSV